jgi:hypothetical protein
MGELGAHEGRLRPFVAQRSSARRLRRVIRQHAFSIRSTSVQARLRAFSPLGLSLRSGGAIIVPRDPFQSVLSGLLVVMDALIADV